jgi:hypothetical protein
MFLINRQHQQFEGDFVLKRISFVTILDRFTFNEDSRFDKILNNNETWSFMTRNIPFFECPDKV